MSLSTDPIPLQELFLDIASLDPGNLDDLSTMAPTVHTPPNMVTPTGNNKIGRCILTIFPPDTLEKWIKPETYFDPAIIHVWCGQFEECPETERLHAHIYVEFKNDKRLRFDAIRSILENRTGTPGNIQIAKRWSNRQRQCAVNYVLKSETRFHDTTSYIWPHNRTKIEFRSEVKPNKKSKQDSTTEQVDYIESKPIHWTWNQILHENENSKKLLAACSWGPKYHAGRHESNPRRTITNVIVLYGAGGTGKTTLAQKWDQREDEELLDCYYKRNHDDGKFWGGGRTAYRGQRIIHLEEFCGQETAANFKEICDIGKFGPSVNVKNGGTQLNHDTVVITSNHHPAAWYRKLCQNDPKQWTPLARRLTKIFFFPEKREDQSLNYPTENNPPYYIDQTEEFSHTDFKTNYENAVAHAELHWPLPTVQENNFNY